MNNSSIWQGKPWQAFKTFAIIFSFIVNIILVLVLLVAAPLIIPIVADIVNPLVGDLNTSFQEMGAASIEQTIEVNDTMGIKFDLPLEESTTVVLSQDVRLQRPATVSFPGNASVIFGSVDLTLPKGLELPVELSLVVPVSQTIPVNLNVPVEIPLAATELGTPFGRLQSAFEPLAQLLDSLPKSNEELGDRILNPSETNSAAAPATQTTADR